MYDLLLVRRRRRRRIAALVSLFCSIGITSLVIISFLGQNTGTFTVSIANSTVRLSLSDKASFANPTSYLRIEQLDAFEEYTYVNVIREELDDEDKPYDYGAQTVVVDGEPKTVLSYLKYTFYVRNMGAKAAQYDLKVNLIECTQAIDGRTLDDTLRVLVYENDLDDSYNNPVHTEEVYAKETTGRTQTDKDGDKTKREFVSTPTNTNKEDEDHPLAKSFESLKTIATYRRGGFFQGQTRRYTLVTWLEGEDQDTLGGEGTPRGATLKLGVEITAYENE